MSRIQRRSFLSRMMLLAAAGSFPWKSLRAERPEGSPESLRNRFPLKRERIYLNTASLGPSPQAVIDVICREMNRMEQQGETCRSEVDSVRQALAGHIHCDPAGLALTRNATEGMNIVAQSLHLEEGDEVLISKHEHVGGSAPWLHLQKKGIIVRSFDLSETDAGILETIESTIGPRTRVVSVSHVTCTTGQVLPVYDIAEMCDSKKVHCCIDGAQALGMISMDIREMAPDFYLASGHKWLYGPKSSGILYTRPGLLLETEPVFAGAWASDAIDLDAMEISSSNKAIRVEYGTRNTPFSLGLKAAVDFVNGIGQEAVETHCRDLANALRSGIQAIEGMEVVGPQDDRTGSAIVSFKPANGKHKEMNAILAREHHIRLREIYENKLDCLRASCALFNTDEEIDRLLSAIRTVLKNH